ncbi:MAG TPA: NAD-dependent epimerase/dehydratase family protein [Symbiobacteriaceae bacterium]|nr:NAD-dependent epimerase/dehydratase family protein [Symbiobacteriaceae bacterium]
MRVLITGGAGFVGSHLAGSLLTAGHDVSVVDDLSTGSTDNLPTGVEFFCKDIRTPLDAIFASVRPEVVYHLAAQVSVPNSMDEPGFDLSVNASGTINVLRAAAGADARKLISVSSAAVYGEPVALPITEEHPTAPLSPYGLSKLTGEAYVRLLAPGAGLEYTIIRPANIYGPRQKTEGEGAVVPAFLGRFLSGADPVIHGDGSQTRDFIYVSDMVSALMAAMNRANGMTLNVSTGSAVTVRELWQQTADLLGWRRPPRHGPVRAGDIPHSVMANDAARRHLQWAPAMTLRAGLAQTLAWSQELRAAAGQQ